MLTGVAATRGFYKGATTVSKVTGVMPEDALSYMKYDDNAWDSCLGGNSMIKINVTDLIPHFSTSFARRHITFEFGIGYAARVYSMVLWKSIVSLSKREVLGKVISGERHIRGPYGLVRRTPQ